MKQKNDRRPNNSHVLVGVLLSIEALAFFLMALIHFGVEIPVEFAADIEPRTSAAILELLCGLLFDAAAVSVIMKKPWARRITISAHIVGIMSIVFLVSVLTAGSGRATGLNRAYRVMMIVLGIGGIFLMTARGKAALGHKRTGQGA